MSYFLCLFYFIGIFFSGERARILEMSRRRKTPVGSGLVFLLAVVAVVLYYAISFAVTVAFFSFPVLVGVICWRNRNFSESPPALPDPRDFNDDEAVRRISNLLGLQDSVKQLISEQYAIGEENGLVLTLHSNETRFASRTNLARQLNKELDKADAILSSVSYQIYADRGEVSRLLPDWNTELLDWSRRMPEKSAFRNSFKIITAVCIILFTLSYFWVDIALRFQKILLWDPAPNFIKSPLIAAVLVGYLSFWWFIKHPKNYLENAADLRYAREWLTLCDKWDQDSDPRDFFEPVHVLHSDRYAGYGSEDQGKGDRNAEASIIDFKWYEILGVAPDSTPDQIKSAYRTAIKAYHSDTVATAGPKLRELAEQESKKINAAYAEARKIKGFR
ncbi:MAG: J domain-containing protein [Mucilaginibacter polytrichastri]|nr:J domain-containing protein [Mucilaginibacter polytrichastri]